jgi:hypothetical protein
VVLKHLLRQADANGYDMRHPVTALLLDIQSIGVAPMNTI